MSFSNDEPDGMNCRLTLASTLHCGPAGCFTDAANIVITAFAGMTIVGGVR